MPTALELPQLLDLSISSADLSNVNFGHLHKLLYEIISKLDRCCDGKDGKQPPPTKDSATAAAPLNPSSIGSSSVAASLKSISGLTKPTSYHQLQDKVSKIEQELSDLHSLPSAQEMMSKVKTDKPLTELWQYMQLSKKVNNNSDGIGTIMGLIEEMARDMDSLKKENKNLQDKLSKIDIDKMNSQLADIDNMRRSLSELDGVSDRLKDFDDYKSMLDDLAAKLASLPDGEELVTWAGMEDALNGIKGEMAAYRPQSRAASRPSTATITPQPPTTQPDERPPTSQSGKKSEISRRSSRAKSAMSDGPTNDVLNVMEHLGSINKRHVELKERVDDLEKRLDDKADKDEINSSIPDDLSEKLEQMTDKISELDLLRQKDSESIKRAQRSVLDLKAELEKVKELADFLNKENDARVTDVKGLKTATDTLIKTKADLAYVNTELDTKADKKSVDGKVNRNLFDSTMKDLQNMIDDLLSKLLAYEEAWKRAHSKLSDDVDDKIDRAELERLKAWVDRKLKDISKKLKNSQNVFDPFCEDAAGIKKQLLPFNCLSCDKPVVMSANKLEMFGTSVNPISQNVDGFSANKSTRPYTTFELDQIRQHAKSLLNADYVMDYYSMPRQCGGSHTMTYPHKRTTKTSYREAFTESTEAPPEMLISVRDEKDIVGADGQVYRGRTDLQKGQIEARLPSNLQDGRPTTPTRPRTSPGRRPGSAATPATSRPKTATPHLAPSELRARPMSARVRPTEALAADEGFDQTQIPPVNIEVMEPVEVSESAPIVPQESTA